MDFLKKLDHFVITTSNSEKCFDFYQKLGFTLKDSGRYELFAGDFKINVHIKGSELSPHAGYVQTGSADFCLEVFGDLKEIKSLLEAKGLEIELGIVERTGVRGKMQSIYLRDPDENLVELCSYADSQLILINQ